MADKDMGERNMLKDELPSASLQICLFHVLRTFKREVTCEKLKISVDERLHMLKILMTLFNFCFVDSTLLLFVLFMKLEDCILKPSTHCSFIGCQFSL
jgi:hypothetical protein